MENEKVKNETSGNGNYDASNIQILKDWRLYEKGQPCISAQ